MATNNQVNVGLSGATGTGNFVGSTSPSITTANLIGTTTNNNAAAGSVGEVLTANNDGAPVTLTNATATNIVTLSLTAGDWDVFGNCTFLQGTALTLGQCVVTLSSAAFPNVAFRSILQLTSGTAMAIALPAPLLRVSIASTTTVYLVGMAIDTVSGATGQGQITARRIR